MDNKEKDIKTENTAASETSANDVVDAEVEAISKKGSGWGRAVFTFLQGALIGLGAMLPGISGGVMCVIFGFYKTIMAFLSHPFSTFKKAWKILLPLIAGGLFGVVVVSKILAYFLETYESPSVCVFIGLIIGMIPSLFREAGQHGRNKNSFISLVICFVVVLALLITLNVVQVTITPNFIWYIFCGFTVALSVIAPGLSFSTLTMPLGLYTPLVAGIGDLKMSVILPTAIGALATVILLAKAVDHLINAHYSVTFHGIIGVVIAATLVIIPFSSFADGAKSCIINIVCLVAGAAVAYLLDKFNQKIDVPED